MCVYLPFFLSASLFNYPSINVTLYLLTEITTSELANKIHHIFTTHKAPLKPPSPKKYKSVFPPFFYKISIVVFILLSQSSITLSAVPEEARLIWDIRQYRRSNHRPLDKEQYVDRTPYF